MFIGQFLSAVKEKCYRGQAGFLLFKGRDAVIKQEKHKWWLRLDTKFLWQGKTWELFLMLFICLHFSMEDLLLKSLGNYLEIKFHKELFLF